MLWKPINFQGIIVIDKELVDQLRSYLEEKSKFLAHSIVDAFTEGVEEGGHAKVALKLDEAVKNAEDLINDRIASKEKINGWRTARESINYASWRYVEVLEGCAMEFLQQLDNVRLDRLTLEVLKTIDSVRVVVAENSHKATDAIRRINTALKKYRDACQPNQSRWRRFFRQTPWRSFVLDHTLVNHLQKTEEALDSRDRELKDAYQEYHRLSLKVQRSLHKLDRYEVLQALDTPAHDKFCEVYRLLKMWKANTRSRALPDQSFLRILRTIATPQQVISTFRDYHKALNNALFEVSRGLKSSLSRSREDVDAQRRKMLTTLSGLSAELHSLGSAIGRFRDFLLRTDPNPYVRSRWGFSEWVVGPEPKEAKELTRVSFAVESLDPLFFQLKQSLEKTVPQYRDIRTTSLSRQIQSVLHEMGQPLASATIMRGSAESLIVLMEQLDELGSADAHVVDYVSEVLGKALRADWKYHVLHENPQFHQLYKIHRGIVGPLDDPSHRSRIQKMKELVEKLKEWNKGGDLIAHAAELETELEEVKGYLQDFLSTLQRAEEEKDQTVKAQAKKKRQQLLEYRYLFGGICQQLLANTRGGDQLRYQFLFIDQYFEFIENKLNDLTSDN